MYDIKKRILSLSVVSLSLVVIGTGALSSGCGSSDHPNVIARVGKYKITQQELDSSSVPIETLNSWLETSLLAMEAESRGIKKSEEFSSLLEKVRINLLAEYLLEGEYAQIAQPTPEEIEKYYIDNTEEFHRAEQEVEVFYFSSPDPTNLYNIKNLLQKGENPTELAEKYPVLQPGREIVVDPASKHNPFTSFATNAVGTVSGPTKIGDRYYVFKIIDRFDAGTAIALPQVRDEIIFRLNRAREQELREKLIKVLRNKYSITIKYDRLKAAGITTGESQ